MKFRQISKLDLSIGGALVLLAAVLLGSLAAFSLNSREDQNDEIEETLQNYAAISEDLIYATFHSYEVTLKTIASEISRHPELIKSYSGASLEGHRKHLLNDRTAQLRILDSSGDLKVATGEQHQRNFAERDFFKMPRDSTQNEIYLSPPFQGKFTPGNLIVLSQKISAPDGKFLGVVMVTLRSTIFEEFRKHLKLGPEDVFAVAAGKQTLFAYSSLNPEAYENHPASEAGLPPGVIDHKLQHSFYTNSSMRESGMKRYMATAWVRRYPLLVVIGKEREVALADWSRSVGYAASLVGFVLIFALAALLYFRKKQGENLKQHLALANSAKFAALGHMAASLAHEINGPLGIIKARAEIIKDVLGTTPATQETANELAPQFERIDRTVERISKIIRGLKSFSRNDAAEALISTKISRILQEASDLSEARFKRERVPLELRLDPALVDFEIECHPTQISQVVLNLMNNALDAIKATDSPWVRVELKPVDDKIEVSVTDSGLGIAPEVAARLMEPFFTTKPVGEGTGLGLSISREIIAAHHGEFYLDSEKQNTCFAFQLPKISAATSKTAA